MEWGMGGILVGMVGLVVSPFHLTLGIEENIGLGLLFKLRGAGQAPSDVVVISIDKESSEVLGLPDNPDKWPRSLHGRLTETLVKEGARVVAFDVHFIEPRSPEDDSLFAEAMRKAGNVVLVEPLKTKELPLPGGGGSDAVGHNIVRVVPPDTVQGGPVQHVRERSGRFARYADSGTPALRYGGLRGVCPFIGKCKPGPGRKIAT
jgi:adenylate cyclase